MFNPAVYTDCILYSGCEYNYFSIIIGRDIHQYAAIVRLARTANMVSKAMGVASDDRPFM